jgi:hypothetical protein
MWRIAEAPAGILLSVGEFSSQFRAGTIYYVEASGRLLIPDVRWYPRGSTARGAIDAFLAGPPPWLAGVTRNPVPPGTTASVELSVDDGATPATMTVTLTGRAAGIVPAERGRIAAALTATLSALPSVSRVEVWCDGDRWGAAPSEAIAPAERTEDSMAFLVQTIDEGPDRLVTLAGEQLEEIDGFDRGAFDQWTSLTVNKDGSAVAGLDNRGHAMRVFKDEGATQQVRGDVGWVPPVFDTNGRLWTGRPLSQPKGVTSFPHLGVPTPIDVPWLVEETLLALAPAPDALRLLVVSREDTGWVRVRLATVERDPSGMPVHLGEPVLVATLGSPPVSMAWVDHLTVALLAPEADGMAPTPALLMPGGLITPMRAPGGSAGTAVAIAAGPDRELLVLTEPGNLFARVGSRWEQRASAIHLVAFPE